MSSSRTGVRRWATLLAAGAGAFIAGGLAVGVITAASAQTDTTGAAPGATEAGGADGDRDESRPQRPDERLLTGTDADKARAAALRKYPGATIERVETDSDGVYEAHLVTTDGRRVTVEVDKNFTVTGEESGHGSR